MNAKKIPAGARPPGINISAPLIKCNGDEGDKKKPSGDTNR